MSRVEDVAIIVNRRDNVATARIPLSQGISLRADGRVIGIEDDVPFGHKFALRPIPAGGAIIKFGDPIGRAKQDIAVGAWVHIHNVESCRGRADPAGGTGRSIRPSWGEEEGAFGARRSASRSSPLPRHHSSADDSSDCDLTFLGFHRADGDVGVRNHLVILPSVACAGHVAHLIAEAVAGAVVIPNQHGCSQIGADREQTFRALVGTAANPNVGAALIVGLGCETISAAEIAHEVSKTRKPVETVIIQDAGGTGNAVELGIQQARAMLRQISALRREPVPISRLVLGTECGGSDTSSGFSANPAVGHASDLLVHHDGTVILSETTEFIGAEHLLQARAVNDEVGARILATVKRVEQSAIDLGVDILGANPSPGNIAGGITTIEEKSLGCIYKSGTAPIADVFAYGQRIDKRGLVIMDTPGNDPVSITGMVAGGAHVVVFTTGRGTPAGAPVVPVVKIATNSGLFARMRDNLDLNAGTIIDGEETIEEVGRRVFELVLRVASGQSTRAEYWGHQEFSIGRTAPTF